jgi:hypothetical protein
MAAAQSAGTQCSEGAQVSGELTRDTSVRARIPWLSPSNAGRPGSLYTVASRAQWHEDEIAWDSARPLSELVVEMTAAEINAEQRSPLAGRGAWAAYREARHAWSVSQLLYGEQGALVVTGRLVETLPDMASKCLAAVQVADEARHVRVLQRYVEVTEQFFPPSPEIETLLGGILEAPTWDYLLLGMQIVLEGLALSIFRSATALFHDPLLSDICERIARDEARHYSFGVVSLSGHLESLTAAERRDRQAYLAEAVRLMADRFRFDAVWERLGIPLAQGRRYAATEPELVLLRRVVFRPVVTALHRIGMWNGMEDVFYGLDLLAR